MTTILKYFSIIVIVFALYVAIGIPKLRFDYLIVAGIWILVYHAIKTYEKS